MKTDNSNIVPAEIEKEVREYTDLPIAIVDYPFPKNHLYCVRGKLCDFAEHQKVVAVYIHPTKETEQTKYKDLVQSHAEMKNALIRINSISDVPNGSTWGAEFSLIKQISESAIKEAEKLNIQ